MRLLLDTHSLLRHADGDPQMSSTATSLLKDPTNPLIVSMATVWEIAIKAGLNKLALSAPFETFMARAVGGYRLTMLDVTLDDCAAYERLPFPDNQHRDPFDRMIIVHAQRHGLSVVGLDAAFDSYGVTRFW